VLRKMLFGNLSEASTGNWKVADMCNKTMTIFLDHLYSGSVNVIEGDIGVFTELVNASDKVTQIIIPTRVTYAICEQENLFISTSFLCSKSSVTKLLFDIPQLIMRWTCTDWLACIILRKQNMTFKTS
jgi:hypothetical protein